MQMNADELLQHSAFLRRLATSLLRGDQEVDDVIQQAYLKALAHRPRRPRAWLGKVVRNLVFRSQRSRARVVRRERAAARPEAVPPPAADIERLETQREIVDAVLGLAEPYRTVIVRRYLDELPTREIARRSGVPYETVRTRLGRALKQLRRRLDGTHKNWGVGLLPLLAAPSAPRTTVIGGLAMSAKQKILILTLPLLGVVVGIAGHAAIAPHTAPPARWTPRIEADRGLTAQLADLRAENDALRRANELFQASLTRDASADESRKAGETRASTPPAVSRPQHRVVDASGQGVPGVQVVVTDAEQGLAIAVADLQGNYVFDSRQLKQLGDGPYALGLAKSSHEGTRYSPASPLKDVSLDQLLARSAELQFRGIAGQLLDPDGQPVKRGVVLARPEGEDEIVAYSGWIGTPGRFAIYGLERGRYDLAYKTALGGSEWSAIEGGGAVAALRTDVELRLLGGDTIEGIVLDEAGEPKPRVWMRATVGTTLTGATSDKEGRFLIKGLVFGQAYRLTSWGKGYVPEIREAVPAGAKDVVFRLDPGWKTAGRLVDGQGRPIAAVTLRIRPESGGRLPLYPQTDQDGRFALAGLPDEPIHIAAALQSRSELVRWTVRPGDENVVLRVEP